MHFPRMRRFVANGIIAVFLCAIAIDGLPSTCKAHQRLKDTIDPVLDATGLWQQPWRLFAPEPDSINTRISAKIRYEDGVEVLWRSPDWQNTTAWERFASFRRMEYFDSLRLDGNSAAWKPFAEYLADTVRPPHNRQVDPVQVALTRHWVTIPKPVAGAKLMPVGGDWTESKSSLFYRWRADQ